MPTGKAKVFMTKDISPAGLKAVYDALGRKATGKVAVKISMGEPGGHNFLAPELIKDLVQSVNGTIVDSNTAYGGRRMDTDSHYQVSKEHGFAAIAPIDILDGEGQISLPVTGGKHLKEDLVGSHFTNYDFHLILSHFKGHAMGGFGGALKNISIGYASTQGKNLQHSAGATQTEFVEEVDQDSFVESMAEAAQAVTAKVGEAIMYINVMNKMSIDCDCDANPAPPEMADIGILGSLDPIALDKACVDLIYAAPDNHSLVERIEAMHGQLILTHGQQLGIGTTEYELVSLDG